jgi:hypothetical protein
LLVGDIEGCGAEALDAGQDGVGRAGPAEGLRVRVDRVDVVVNGVFERAYGTMDAAADLFVGQLGEEPLDGT